MTTERCRCETSVKRPAMRSTWTFGSSRQRPARNDCDEGMAFKRTINPSTGDRRGMLTFIREVDPGVRSDGSRVRRALFRCECGTPDYVNRLDRWWHGSVSTCGCGWPASRTHGLSAEPWFASWSAMIRRCREHPAYVDVEVCDRWHDPRRFAEDMASSHFIGAHLARVGDSGNYEPGNARWLTPAENAAELNERIVIRLPDGRVGIDVARAHGIKPSTYHQRLRRGMSVTDAATTPVPAPPRGRQWAVVAEMTPVPSRGRGAHR